MRIPTLLAALLASTVHAAPDTWVFFGCVGKEDPGIYRAGFDSTTGDLGDPECVYAGQGMSFLAISPDSKLLYAVESLQNPTTGGVTSFRLDAKSGEIEKINSVSIGSRGACHVCVTPDGRTVATADYGEGKVASFRVAEDGSLSETLGVVTHEGSSVNERRQSAPHAHCVIPSLDGRFLYSADLGADKVFIYAVADDSKLAPNPAQGSVKVKNLGGGPRHFTIHPSLPVAYTNLEMTSQVTAFALDAEKGSLDELTTVSTLPEPVEGNSTSEILCHPSGKFLYCANRGHNSIAAFAIDPASGALTPIGHEPCGGEIPRNFGITPDGGWIFTSNQNSGNTAVLKVDAESGELSLTQAKADLPRPMCSRFVRIPK